MEDLEQKQEANPTTEGPQSEVPASAAPPAESVPAANTPPVEAGAPAAAPTDSAQATPAASAAETAEANGGMASTPAGAPAPAPATAPATASAADAPANGALPVAALPAESEPQEQSSRVPAILLAVAVALVGGTVALAAVQKSMRSSLFVVTERAAVPGTVEKYGEAPDLWRVYPELRTKWSCRLHGGTWISQTWKDASGKQSSRSLCRAD